MAGIPGVYITAAENILCYLPALAQILQRFIKVLPSLVGIST